MIARRSRGWRVVAAGLLAACAPASGELSDAERAAVIDTARAVAERVFAASNRLDFTAALQEYSPDADARFVENGSLFPTLDSMRAAYAAFSPMLDSLQNRIERWDILVLGRDAALLTLPVSLRIKAKDLPAYSGSYVWTALVQRRSGAWKVVSSHESWLNAAEVIAALTPPASRRR